MLEISQEKKKANIREKTERKGETKQKKKKRGKNWEHEMIHIKRQKQRDEKKKGTGISRIRRKWFPTHQIRASLVALW